eukprot:Pgem_evm2s19546
MPVAFTANYFYEIDSGTISCRKSTVEKAETIHTFIPVDKVERTKIAIMKELFGTDRLDRVRDVTIQLPHHKGKQLTEKKLKSLKTKYSTIPVEYLSYFPSVEESEIDDVDEYEEVSSDSESGKENCTNYTNTNNKTIKNTLPKKRLGRPAALPQKRPFN